MYICNGYIEVIEASSKSWVHEIVMGRIVGHDCGEHVMNYQKLSCISILRDSQSMNSSLGWMKHIVDVCGSLWQLGTIGIPAKHYKE